MLQAALLIAPLVAPSSIAVLAQEDAPTIQEAPVPKGRPTESGLRLIQQDALTPKLEAMGYVSDWLHGFNELHGVDGGLTGVIFRKKREGILLMPGRAASGAFDRHFDMGIRVRSLAAERAPLAGDTEPIMVTLFLEIPSGDQEEMAVAGELLGLSMGCDARIELVEIPRSRWSAERSAWLIDGLKVAVAPTEIEAKGRARVGVLKAATRDQERRLLEHIRIQAADDKTGKMRAVIEREENRSRDSTTLDVELQLGVRPSVSAPCVRNYFFLLHAGTATRFVHRIELSDRGADQPWGVSFTGELKD